MDERLKKKLELLGEPTLPDRLSAEELFRRMDSGELVLPEDGPLPQEEDKNRKVIPWLWLMRRGLPVAACLALVVLLSQTGLWRSGGDSFSVSSSAPQWAADQTAPSGGDAPAEVYPIDEDADDDAPEPGPRSILMEDEAEPEETAEAAATDLARLNGTENTLPVPAETDDKAENAVTSDSRPDPGDRYPSEDRDPPTGGGSFAEDEDYDSFVPPDADLHPDTGGPGDDDTSHPDTGGPSGDDTSHPDTGGPGDDDPPTFNPDTGGGGYDKDDLIYLALMELADQLSLQVDELNGLIMYFRGYDGVADDDGRLAEVTGYISYVTEDYETEYLYFLYCRVTWTKEGPQLELIEYGEWDYPSGGGDSPDGGSDGSDGSDGDPNPDTSGGGQNPDISSGDDGDDDGDDNKNPDLGAEDKEESEDGNARDDGDDSEEEAEQEEQEELEDTQEEDGPSSESEIPDDPEEENSEELGEELSLPSLPMDGPDSE